MLAINLCDYDEPVQSFATSVKHNSIQGKVVQPDETHAQLMHVFLYVDKLLLNNCRSLICPCYPILNNPLILLVVDL